MLRNEGSQRVIFSTGISRLATVQRYQSTKKRFSSFLHVSLVHSRAKLAGTQILLTDLLKKYIAEVLLVSGFLLSGYDFITTRLYFWKCNVCLNLSNKELVQLFLN